MPSDKRENRVYFECEECGRTALLLFDDPEPRLLMQCDDGHAIAMMTPMERVWRVTSVSNDIRRDALELAGELRERAFDNGSDLYAEGLCEAADEIEALIDRLRVRTTPQEGDSA